MFPHTLANSSKGVRKKKQKHELQYLMILSNYPSIFRNEKWTTVFCWGLVNKIKSNTLPFRVSWWKDVTQSHAVEHLSHQVLLGVGVTWNPGPVPKNYGKRNKYKQIVWLCLVWFLRLVQDTITKMKKVEQNIICLIWYDLCSERQNNRLKSNSKMQRPRHHENERQTKKMEGDKSREIKRPAETSDTSNRRTGN